MHERVKWWPVALHTAKKIIELLIENKPRSCAKIIREVTAFTDASKIGWGVVILWPTNVEVVAGVWTADEHISILETRAVLYAVRALPPNQADEKCILTLMIDNTSAIGALRGEWWKTA